MLPYRLEEGKQMGSSITKHEAMAALVLRRLVEQFSLTGRASTTFEEAMARVPPPERAFYAGALAALQEHRMVGEQQGELFVTQYGQLFLEYAIPTTERRALPLKPDEREQMLGLLKSIVRADIRLDPSAVSSLPHTEPPPVYPGDPWKFWLGAICMGVILLLFLRVMIK
jgi:hypothetical protein